MPSTILPSQSGLRYLAGQQQLGPQMAGVRRRYPHLASA